jgi:RHS repeat-associated protein
LDERTYDAFGNITSDNQIIANSGDRYSYTGAPRDSETGQIDDNARLLDTVHSRWYQQDPTGFNAGDSNLYRYVDNDATNLTDPTGLNEQPAQDGSNLQWITADKMEDLVSNQQAHVVAGTTPHRIVITAYGDEVRAFDYKQDVNPASLGARQWALARSYGLGPIGDEASLGAMLARVDTDTMAQRLASNTNAEAVSGGQIGALNSALVGFSLVPGGAAAEAIDQGNYVDAMVSFAGDVALLGSVRAKWVAQAAALQGGAAGASALAKANSALVRFQAVEGAIAVTRIGQGGYAIAQGDNGKAAGYFGEAVLRIFGVAYARRVTPATPRIVRGSNPSRVTFDGMEVRSVRDLSHLDEGTLRFIQQRGVAPRDINGQPLQLHHLDQNPAGPLVEIPAPAHNIANRVQHPLGNQAGAGLTAEQRAAFNDWRTRYWQERAREELARRGLQ